MFFEGIKTKIRNKNIIRAIVGVLGVLIATWFAAMNGFSSESEWKFGIKFSDLGIPIPNWLVSCIIIVVGLIFLFLLVLSLKDLISNENYNKMLTDAKNIGELQFVENVLQNTPKSNLAKGELRCNNLLVFYMDGTDISLFPTKWITGIRPLKSGDKSGSCYVEIQYQGGSVKIETKEADLVPLANVIVACARAAQ